MTDRRKNWRDAERHLKRGDIQAALSEIRKVSESAPGDIQTLNRLGDLLARQGRSIEAVDYYAKVAEHFEQRDFAPKAIAMYKKIVRLDPHNLPAMVRLGELYLKRKLVGEARNYLLHAANQYLQAENFTEAREVYTTLVEAQPEDLRHQVRLSEARAADGDVDGAVAGLLVVGESLLATGDVHEADPVFSRAAELAPDDPATFCAVHRCMAAQGRTDEAVGALEARSAADSSPVVLGELALAYDLADRTDEALSLLTGDRGCEIPSGVWQEFVRRHLERGDDDAIWERTEGFFTEMETSSPGAVASILDALTEIDPAGYLPALERLCRHHERLDDPEQTANALERLAAASRARCDESSASRAEERIQGLRERIPAPPRTEKPEPIVLAEEPEPPTAAAGPAPVAVSVPPVLEGEVPHEFLAPAVPLGRADEEFVAGGLTQAEVMEKYDLAPQALEQLDEVVARFPGHVGSQRSRVALLRTMEEPSRLAAALAHLALALRADGDLEGARKVADEAATFTALEPKMRDLLYQLSLVEERKAAPKTTARDIAPEPIPLSVPDALSPAPDPVAVEEVDILELEEGIDFDADELDTMNDLGEATDVPPQTMTDGGPKRAPGQDMLDEIRRSLLDSQPDQAEQRLSTLRTLGYSSDEMDDLGREIQAALAVSESEAPVVEAIGLGSGETVGSADDAVEIEGDHDLEAITSALSADVEDDDTTPLVPEAATEQSMEEILAAFKERVSDEVASDDHRTHYDLGIAYKEMGLVDEAIEEFRVATESETLHCEACSMIALCHWEQDDLGSAADWYRQALKGPAGSEDVLVSLRYDLAEVLLQAGDTEAALNEFRSVQEVEPGFRNVEGRVTELESRLQS